MVKFHFDSAEDSKEIGKHLTSVCSNVYDVTGFANFGFHKNKNLNISRPKHYFFFK